LGARANESPLEARTASTEHPHLNIQAAVFQPCWRTKPALPIGQPLSKFSPRFPSIVPIFIVLSTNIVIVELSAGALPQSGWDVVSFWAGQVDWSDQESDMHNEFQHTLQRLLAESGKSLTQVAVLGGVDRAYLKRLLAGEKTNPSAETILRIWMGLAMDPRVVRQHPEFPHGLSELLLASAMSHAPSRLAGKTN
jgi:DNA-binding phage protein